MSGIRIARRDVFWTYANLVLSSGVNLLLLPLILWALTPDEVGQWYVYSALGGLSLVLDFGLSATLSRHVTFAWCGVSTIEKQGYTDQQLDGQPNYPLLRSLVAATKWAYHLVGATALLLAATVGTLHVQHAVHAGSIVDKQLTSWWVYVAAIWINTSMAYWNPLLRGVGAVAETGQANVAGKIAQLLFTSAALVAGFGLLGVSVSYLASTFVFRWMSKRYFRRRSGLLHESRDEEGAYSRSALLRTIWPNAARQGVVSLSQYVMTWSPVLISSGFLGLRQAATVGLTVQILGIIKVFGNALFNAFLPQFSSLRLTGDLDRLRARVALVLGSATYSILGLGTLALVVGPPGLHLLGTDVRLMPLAYGLCFFLSEWAVNQYALVSGYLGTANRVPMHKAYFITALVGTAGQFLAVSRLGWGLWGVIVPPLLASLVYNDWIWFRRAATDLRTTSLGLLGRSLTEPYVFVATRIGVK
ncbi:O-unit flippase-like protein [Phycicoccus sp. M110.8]|uniref:O-unit flippase-like protein n=1 Tax=Phycicoccus sp. M110.8 TaxID=3075433 RepID=UPI0028FD41B7|nr:O-unit flippase-like protein [Phycicoccus sp. M110.8]MDU0314724.1 O-unit flippase-like protein [Phycicoccus sp. M110.8]